MTDRVKGCWVAFDQDYRVDDVEAILEAIRMIKGVADVSTEKTVTQLEDWTARVQVKRELAEKMWQIYKEITETA